jgi:hypothetical protein
MKGKERNGKESVCRYMICGVEPLRYCRNEKVEEDVKHF